MKNRILGSALIAILVSVGVYAAEVTDLETVDGSNTNANFGFPENMAPSSVNDNMRATQGIIARWYSDWRGEASATGSGNAIDVSTSRTISSYEDGFLMVFEATAANTGATTVNFGAGAKSINKFHDQALASGDIEAGQKVIVIYNSDDGIFQMVSSIANAVGFNDPMTTQGDLIARITPNTTGRLGIGVTNAVLFSDGTDIAWSTTPSSVVHTGVKSFGWENRMAQPSPIHL